MAAPINALVFAYLGTARPLLVTLVLHASSFSAALKQAVVAVEVVGSLGVLATVPLTTVVAAAWRGRTALPAPAMASASETEG